VRSQLSKHVEDVVKTHEPVTITKNGKPAAVLISAEDLDALEETLFWARQDRVDVEGPTVGLAVVMSDVHARQDRD
jgi:prevent-host-death family protein